MKQPQIELANEIERNLFERHGPMIADDALLQALGYCSVDAFRQAFTRGTLPVPVFAIKHRRGKYALVKDVAQWIAEQRFLATTTNAVKPDAGCQ
ncbi:hypothetical protein WAE56_19980 [Iodobacter sp. LRB]|uniref:hypothetical protein n=1 Tax=unclassified Iodobacter TaxID=235634 RepID=UPI000C0EC08E|nr:hypothetical protein [Iodobacter sp. BJB302]PHU99675.1 hypothetical protein CSQ88_21220 [Iodobacter sp. BJB302]